MPDGDYRDIWIAFAFGMSVFALGAVFLPDTETAATILLILMFGGGALVRQLVADWVGRRRQEDD